MNKNINLNEISDLDIAKEVLTRRKNTIAKCVDIINEHLAILDGFGVKVYDDDKTMILHSLKAYDEECVIEVEYI